MTMNKEHTKTVELLKPHTHAGRSYSEEDVKNGVTLTMHKDSADWLISLKKAKEVTAKQ